MYNAPMTREEKILAPMFFFMALFFSVGAAVSAAQRYSNIQAFCAVIAGLMAAAIAPLAIRSFFPSEKPKTRLQSRRGFLGQPLEP